VVVSILNDALSANVERRREKALEAAARREASGAVLNPNAVDKLAKTIRDARVTHAGTPKVHAACHFGGGVRE
jgi:hypothetical protein